METGTSGVFEELHIDPPGRAYLNEAVRWARFLAITGFAGSGLLAVAGLFYGLILPVFFPTLDEDSSSANASLIFGCLVGAAFVFFPFFFLFRFANRMHAALRSSDQKRLTQAFSSLETWFKFLGILTIFILLIIVLSIVLSRFQAARV